MARGISLVSLVVSLLLVGWLLTAQHPGTRDKTTSTEIQQAGESAAGVSFQQAETQLEAYHALHGTYAGTSLRGFGVTLVRADASSYCIQNASSHLAGPGGAVAAGGC